MKYQMTVDIALPRSRVIELFDSQENLYKWQPELLSFEPLSGEPGEVGAKSKLHYKMDGREFDMIETITEKRLPEVFAGTYEMGSMWNKVDNLFTEKDDNTTEWVVDSEFKGGGVMMKLMMWFAPGMFKKQTGKFMSRFKAFCENEG